VTILNPEQGVLLVRMRDELRMNLAAYRTLYETFEMGGDHVAEVDPAEEHKLEGEVESLEARAAALKDQVYELNHIIAVSYASYAALPPCLSK
ncbi:IDA4, partial [Symbiodinium sp. KB8]